MPAGGLVTAGVISGATGLYSAHHTANAAKKAAAQQQTATEKALAIQQQASAPYMQLGQSAVQRLQNTPFQPYTQQFGGKGGASGFQAFTPSPSNAALAQAPAPLGYTPQPGQLSQGPMASHLPSGPPMQGGPSPYALGAQGPPAGPPPMQGNPYALGSQAPPPPDAGAPNAPQGQLVKMRAPDGTVQMVDLAHVPVYRAKGAQVVA